MDNAEPYDLVTVLLGLQTLKGMGRGHGHAIDEDLSVTATDTGRTSLFGKMLASLRRRAAR
ncbi:MAG: hypothetical protein WBO12_23525 [Xanthobacteraceae bacterium]